MLRREFLLGTTALTMVASPAQAALIVVTGPNLNEIQDKLDAGEFPHYPGVVREGQWGRRYPSSSRYLMARQLKPGTALPTVKVGNSLLRAAQSKKVTVAPFKRGRNATLVRLAKNNWTDFVLNQADRQEFVMVPEFFNELAYQNGIEPYEIATHVHQYREDQQTDLDTYLANQTEIIKAIAIGENLIVLDQEIIDAKLEEIETLKAAAEDGLQSEALQYLIDHLELEIENLTGETLLAALSESIIGERIANIANENIEEIHAFLREDGPVPVNNHLWTLAMTRAQEALDNVEIPETPEFETPRLKATEIISILRDHPWKTILRDGGSFEELKAAFIRGGFEELVPFTTQIGYILGDFIVYLNNTVLPHVYGQGYSEGFEAGYAEGYEDGYRDGYADGFRDGANSVKDTLEG